jgi:hypothetical protein
LLQYTYAMCPYRRCPPSPCSVLSLPILINGSPIRPPPTGLAPAPNRHFDMAHRKAPLSVLIVPRGPIYTANMRYHASVYRSLRPRRKRFRLPREPAIWAQSWSASGDGRPITAAIEASGSLTVIVRMRSEDGIQVVERISDARHTPLPLESIVPFRPLPAKSGAGASAADDPPYHVRKRGFTGGYPERAWQNAGIADGGQVQSCQKLDTIGLSPCSWETWLWTTRACGPRMK